MKDPEPGEVAEPEEPTEAVEAEPVPGEPARAAEGAEDLLTDGPGSEEAPADPPEELGVAELLAERTNDLQRLHAEYANYKKRVDRDRALSRQGGIESVVLDLLPVLDSVEAAREHDELTGGFRLVADELEKIAGKYGLVTYGEIGEEFDPQIHDALLQMPHAEEVSVPTISAVIQRGVKLNDRVLRPARVGVANP